MDLHLGGGAEEVKLYTHMKLEKPMSEVNSKNSVVIWRHPQEEIGPRLPQIILNTLENTMK